MTSYQSKTAPKEKPVTQERVTNYAFWLLSQRDYTVATLQAKLCTKFKENLEYCDISLNKLIDGDYLDDQRYIERLISSLLEQKIGSAKIKEKLYNKRFSRELIGEFSDMIDGADYEDKALEVLQRKYRNKTIEEYSDKQKAIAFVVRRGFSFSEGKKAVDTFINEQEMSDCER